MFNFPLELILMEPPNKNQPVPEPTNTYFSLQEYIDHRAGLGNLTTSTPATTTTKPSRKSRQRGQRKKDKSRVKGPTEIQNGAVRLVGNELGRNDRGRVEIYINGEWGTVCDDLWTTKNARVVCQQLGFQYTLKASKNSEFGEGKHLQILLDDVQCEGTESTLLDCQHAGVGIHNCAHHEDAGVICVNSESIVEA